MYALTPSTIRFDAPGRRCGQGYIAAGKKCQAKGAFPTRAALVAGVGLTGIAAAGMYAHSRRVVPARVTVSNFSPVVGASAPQPALPGDRTTRRLRAERGTRQLRGTAPYGLLPPSPPRQGKTARMRANTGAAVRNAERRIAQTAREEVRRIGQIGNTMAAAGEASGMAAKTSWREVRLRVEAARRRFEPGYRRGRTTARGPSLLRGSSAEPLRVGLTPRAVSPQRLRRRTDAAQQGKRCGNSYVAASKQCAKSTSKQANYKLPDSHRAIYINAFSQGKARHLKEGIKRMSNSTKPYDIEVNKLRKRELRNRRLRTAAAVALGAGLTAAHFYDRRRSGSLGKP